MLEEAREFMCKIFLEHRGSDVALKASELVDLLILEEMAKNEKYGRYNL